jgi:integrase
MRFCTREEVKLRIATAPKRDRALWATAFYAGLRRGELMALDAADIDLAGGRLHIRRAYDPVEGVFIDPKSYAGRRRVPIAGALRDILDSADLPQRGLVFGRAPDRPFSDQRVGERARTAWKAHGLDAVTLHQCRHTYASLMIAAGVSAKALQTYMGHSSITITYDRYGHLMPDIDEQSAAELDAYLARGAGDETECGEVRGEVPAGEGKS